jgi:hypothetical protein
LEELVTAIGKGNVVRKLVPPVLNLHQYMDLVDRRAIFQCSEAFKAVAGRP